MLLTAPWCTWCRVLEHEVLTEPEVKRWLDGRFLLEEIDVDAHPSWMDRPGVAGLPSLLFFDRDGRHTLTKSGYHDVQELVLLFEGALHRMDRGEAPPFEVASQARKLPAEPLTPAAASELLVLLERAVFMKVNGFNGGFHSPARHPFPGMLVALQEWVALGGAPARVSGWIDNTKSSALKGTSPRLRGEARADMDLDKAGLIALSVAGPGGGTRWSDALEKLEDADTYWGIQDPFDGGVFRYAAGPGWYHPHFERRAADNLSWVQLLRLLNDKTEADRILRFVMDTFAAPDGKALRASQRADAFYYRLTPAERAEVEAPPVATLYPLLVQARAAQLDPERCALLTELSTDHWPKGVLTAGGKEVSDGRAATVDEVGELLLGLAACAPDKASALARTVVARWSVEALPPQGQDGRRLHRLAAGLCAAAPDVCPRALAALKGLRVSLDHPPPFAALARLSPADAD